MTATPKENRYISNIDYFGDPLYSYSLRAGIEDGFLAPFRVINVKTNIGDGWRPVHGQRDINGVLIEDRIYNNSDYDYNIIIQDRIDEVAKEITAYLKNTDRMAKTIVFCANEDHAERMRQALVRCNADMCQKNADYVVRITGSDVYGKKKLKPFISVGAKFPVIATTAAGAPMLGFLGTVTGMVRAFFDMANAGTNVDVALLSGGIYEALVTTVGGLIVGIIALFGYNYLVSQVDNVVNKMEARTMEFMDLLNEPAN